MDLSLLSRFLIFPSSLLHHLFTSGLPLLRLMHVLMVTLSVLVRSSAALDNCASVVIGVDFGMLLRFSLSFVWNASQSTSRKLRVVVRGALDCSRAIWVTMG